MEKLFLFFFHLDGLQVLCLENLAAIETLDVIYSVSARNNLGTVVVTSGLHNSA
jgi:hypothetical protein